MPDDLSAISRWSWIAFCKKINDALVGTEVNVWFDGQDTHSTDWLQWAEVFMGGPRYSIRSVHYKYFDAELLIGLLCHEDPKDAHAHLKLRDTFVTILQAQESIPVVRDDGSLVGCYLFRRDVPRMIDGYDYSRPNSTTKLMRASVEGYYRMEITW